MRYRPNVSARGALLAGLGAIFLLPSLLSGQQGAAEAQKQAQQELDQARAAQQEAAEAKRDLAEAKRAQREAMRKRHQAQQKALRAAEQAARHARSANQRAAQHAERLGQQVEQAKTVLDQAKQAVAARQGEIKQTQKQIADLQKQLAQLNNQLARQQKAVETRQQALAQAQEQAIQAEKRQLAALEKLSAASRTAAEARARLAEPVDLAKLKALPAVDAETLHVTEHRLDFNGRKTIPVNMFGQHASNLSQQQFDQWGLTGFRQIYQDPSAKPVMPGDKGVPGAPDYVVPDVPYILECWFDRYQVVWPLRDPKGWRDHFRQLARKYGPAAEKTGRTHHIQFWNEPIWNGPNRPGQNFDGTYYVQDDTTPGKPATIKTHDKPAEFLVWDEPRLRAVRAETGWRDYLATRYAPRKIEEKGETRDVKDGDVVEWRGMKFRWEQMPWVKDTSMAKDQYGYPGKHHVDWYVMQFAEFSKQMHEANPNVNVIGGWGFNIFSWGWRGWRKIHKPIVDEAWQWMDGMAEHHYRANPWMTATSYEVVNAYTMGNYGKKLKFYNTECGWSAGGPPRAKEGENPEQVAFQRWDQHWLKYSIRDLSIMLTHQLDKAYARAEHMPHNNKGSRYVFMMFKQLRGDLVYVRFPNPKIWGVASHNADNQLCVVIYNDTNEDVTVPVAVDAPSGTQLAGGYLDRHVAKGYEYRLIAEEVELPDPRRYTAEIDIPRDAGVKLLFHLVGQVDQDIKTVTVRQHLAKETLQYIEPDKPYETSIQVPGKDLADVQAAYLRFAVQDWHAGRSQLVLNDKPIELPVAYNWLNDVQIDPKRLQEKNALRFEHVGHVGREEGKEDKKPYHVFFASFLTVSQPR